MDIPFLGQLAQTNPSELTAYVAAAIMGVWAAVNQIKASRVEKKTAKETEVLSDAKMFQEKAELMSKAAQENLDLFHRERDEHAKTREYWHTRAQDFQLTLTKCQEKLTELNARPDFSAVVKFIEEQARTSVEILLGIKAILSHIEEIAKSNGKVIKPQ